MKSFVRLIKDPVLLWSSFSSDFYGGQWRTLLKIEDDIFFNEQNKLYYYVSENKIKYFKTYKPFIFKILIYYFMKFVKYSIVYKFIRYWSNL